MTAFAGLHRAGHPFVLPNAWDVASALMLQDAGFAAIATTSLGVNAAAGLVDGSGDGLRETLRLVELLTGRLSVPLSVDFEGGFSDDPAVVARHCRRLAELGVAGLNLEDGHRSPDLHQEIVAAVVRGCPGLFVNARTDVHWLKLGDEAGRTDEVLRRLTAYVSAGAHGVFVPGLADPEQVAGLTAAIDAPLNLLWSPALDVAALRGAGVARFSLGSGPYRAALTAARAHAERARELAQGRIPATDPAPIGYDEVQRLLGSDRR